jgi:hypothetical protein
MAMSLNDAHLFYERAIPAGAVDPSLPDRFTTAPRARTRLANVREKPEAIVARMAKALAMLAGSNNATIYALKPLGFSDAEIAAHGPDALRKMIVDNPTLPSLEWGC